MIVSTTGYRDNSKDRNERYLTVPSNRITMEGVSKTLRLIPVKNGRPDFSKSVIASPGDPDYYFEGYDSVMEIPLAQDGIKTEFNRGDILLGPTQTNNPFQGFLNVDGYSLEDSANAAGRFISGYDVIKNAGMSPEHEKMAKTANTIGLVGSLGNTALGLTREFLTGLGTNKRVAEDLKRQREEEVRFKVNQNNYVPSFQLGGKMDKDSNNFDIKLLTGMYTTGTENDPNQNAVVEAREYIVEPGKLATKVIGDRHSDTSGGESMNLEEGSIVLSDHLKVGNKLSKLLTQALGFKVGSKSTFSKVADVYSDKIGLTGKLDELEKTLKLLQKQEDVESKDTAGLNREFLSEKYQQQSEEVEQLQGKLTDLIQNGLFPLQEASKGETPTAQSFQDGGQQGQEEQILQAYSQFSGIPLDQLVAEYQKLSPEDKQEALQEMVQEMQGGGQEEQVAQIIQQYAQMLGVSPEEVAAQLQSLPEEQQAQALQQMADELQGSQEGAPQMQDGGFSFRKVLPNLPIVGAIPEFKRIINSDTGIMDKLQQLTGTAVFELPALPTVPLRKLIPDSFKTEDFDEKSHLDRNNNYKESVKHYNSLQDGGRITEEDLPTDDEVKDMILSYLSNVPTTDGSEMTPEEMQQTAEEIFARYQSLQTPDEKVEMLQGMYTDAQRGNEGGFPPQPISQGFLQDGGEQQAPQITEEQLAQLIQMFAEITGQDPQEIVEQLEQMSPEQAREAIMQMIEVVQQAEAEQSQSQESFAVGGIVLDIGDPNAKKEYQDPSELPSFVFANPYHNQGILLEYPLQHKSADDKRTFGDIDLGRGLNWYSTYMPYTSQSLQGDLTPSNIKNFQSNNVYNKHLDETSVYGEKKYGIDPQQAQDFVERQKFLVGQDPDTTARADDSKVGNYTISRSTFIFDALPDRTTQEKLNAQGIYTAKQLANNPEVGREILGDEVYDSIVDDEVKDSSNQIDFVLGYKNKGSFGNFPSLTGNYNLDPISTKDLDIDAADEKVDKSKIKNKLNLNFNSDRLPYAETFLYLPEYHNIQPHLVQKEAISPQEEINQTTQMLRTAMDVSRFNPTAGPQIANTLSQLSTNINNITAKVNGMNLSGSMNVDQRNNASTLMAAQQNANAKATISNQRAQSIQHFFEELYAKRFKEYERRQIKKKDRTTSNYLNEMFDNIKVDANGNISYQGTDPNIANMLKGIFGAKLQQTEAKKKAKEEATAPKQMGGKIDSYIRKMMK